MSIVHQVQRVVEDLKAQVGALEIERDENAKAIREWRERAQAEIEAERAWRRAVETALGYSDDQTRGPEWARETVADALRVERGSAKKWRDRAIEAEKGLASERSAVDERDELRRSLERTLGFGPTSPVASIEHRLYQLREFADARISGENDRRWRESIEKALGVEADAENHTPEWAEEIVLKIREIGNRTGFTLDAKVSEENDELRAREVVVRRQFSELQLEVDGLRRQLDVKDRSIAEIQAECVRMHDLWAKASVPHLVRRKLPVERPAITKEFRIGPSVSGYVTVGLFEDGSPGEVFIVMDKVGSTINGLCDTVAVLASLALQYGVPLRRLVEQFERIRFEPDGQTGDPEIPIAHSIVDYVFRWLGHRFLPKELPPIDAASDADRVSKK